MREDFADRQDGIPRARMRGLLVAHSSIKYGSERYRDCVSIGAVEMARLRYVVLATIVISTAYIGACEETNFKRELPLSLNCNPLAGTCYKGDLIEESIADCKRDSFFSTCDPINDKFLSSVVDIPDDCFFVVPAVSQ